MKPITVFDSSVKVLRRYKESAANRIQFLLQEIEEKNKQHGDCIEEMRRDIEEGKKVQEEMTKSIEVLEQATKESE